MVSRNWLISVLGGIAFGLSASLGTLGCQGEATLAPGQTHTAISNTSIPTATPIPTATSIPLSIDTPTPIAIPTPTPTLVPTPIAVPTPTPTSSPTPKLLPTPEHTSGGRITVLQGVYLIADGRTDTYQLISSVLGGTPIESPDCSHRDFGPHITQEWDNDLKKHSFVFHIHVTPDDDRCKSSDRQRTEIKAYSASPNHLKGFLGETVIYRWRFKLDDGFQPSNNFTHIHQLKDVGGKIGSPIITLTPRTGAPDQIEISHYNSTGDRFVLATAPLKPFIGVWVEAYERITYGHEGSYSIELRTFGTGALLFAYHDPKLDLWRVGGKFVRPKWGIYRSLDSQKYLRDEQVRFDQFCLAKGSEDCPKL